MEHIIYTAKPLSRKRFRIFKRTWGPRKKITQLAGLTYSGGVITKAEGKEKQYYAYSEPKDTGIITKNPKAVIFALTKKDEGERRIKKNA